MTLTNVEIEEAITAHIRNQGINLKHKIVDVQFERKGKRGEPRTYRAIVTITEEEIPPNPTEPDKELFT